jgi:tRNA A-37 threonylcarbamoyl transferase component Bud32
MATVFLAQDTVLRRRVALKRLHTSADARELARLRREALVGASLNHRNLVAVYDVYGEDDGQLVIVMEYVAGETLRQTIRSVGAIPPRRALEILEQLAAGLDAIHARGIVHRDVKPANVLLGTGGEVKLADLGIAAAPDRTQTTAGAELAGTFSYMAPEQLEGRAARATVDIYALAAVAFEMLCGRKARQESNPVALAHAICTRPPPDLRVEWPDAPAMAAAVLRRGMAERPDERPTSAGALVARLREALEPHTTEAGTLPPDVRRAVAPKRAAPAPAARRVPRAQPPIPKRAEVTPSPRDRIVAGGTGAALSRQPMLAGPARRAPRAHRRARVGAVLALLLAAIIVALVITLGSGGTGQTNNKVAKRGVRSTHTPRAATRSSRASSGTGAHRGSASKAAATQPSVASTPAGQGESASKAAATQPAVASTPAAQAPVTPAASVEAFYGYAARHEYAAAWGLADANMRNQLAGFDSFRAQQSAVRSITFHRAQTLADSGESSSSATVALQTTAVLSDRTEQCGGTARLVRNAGEGWLLDGISINCTP